MKLHEILTDLSYNELSNHSMSEDGTGTIREQQIPKVVSSITSVMRRLHTNFVMSRKQLTIILLPEKTRYELKPEYAFSQNIVPVPGIVPYIVDSLDDPFTGDVLQLLEFRDRYNRPLSLNDPDGRYGIRSSRPDVFWFSEDRFRGELKVTYKAKYMPPVLDFCNLEEEVEIPDYLYGALRSGIAAEIYGAMSGQEHLVLAQKHKSDFDTWCNEVVKSDVISQTESDGGTQFDNRGFV